MDSGKSTCCRATRDMASPSTSSWHSAHGCGTDLEATDDAALDDPPRRLPADCAGAPRRPATGFVLPARALLASTDSSDSAPTLRLRTGAACALRERCDGPALDVIAARLALIGSHEGERCMTRRLEQYSTHGWLASSSFTWMTTLVTDTPLSISMCRAMVLHNRSIAAVVCDDTSGATRTKRDASFSATRSDNGDAREGPSSRMSRVLYRFSRYSTLGVQLAMMMKLCCDALLSDLGSMKFCTRPVVPPSASADCSCLPVPAVISTISSTPRETRLVREKAAPLTLSRFGVVMCSTMALDARLFLVFILMLPSLLVKYQWIGREWLMSTVSGMLTPVSVLCLPLPCLSHSR
mmetsp:Transcript_31863/g.98591  ORF Transcript_31863/g.98591 Transcript_31863/m.98591 type:complete len:352 (+) Transcript_31863:180-1235(+)